MNDRKLILSFTSYPARIQSVPLVLDSLLDQTRPADLVVLYLSADQFSRREEDLPEDLVRAAENGQVLIRWVEGDLKPHKKYFYAFREYPGDYIVTVDDDVLYDRTFLETLWETHLAYPDAVAAGRTHLITLDRDGRPNPYRFWLHRTLGFEEGPSMQLFAVGIGGVLYDPQWFPEELFNEAVIRETCLTADDLWLKTMELAAGIPVVHSPASAFFRIVPGSQKSSLYQFNLHRDQNDTALSAIRQWADAFYGKDLYAGLLTDARWSCVRDDLSLYGYLNRERQRLMDRDHETRMMLRAAEKSSARKEEKIVSLRRQVDSLHQGADQLRRDEDRLNAEIDLLRREIDRINHSFPVSWVNVLKKPFRKP